MTVRNKWTFGSGIVKYDILVVLLWTRGSEVYLLAFWVYLFFCYHGTHCFGSFVYENSYLTVLWMIIVLKLFLSSSLFLVISFGIGGRDNLV